jgi:hypothetical protein
MNEEEKTMTTITNVPSEKKETDVEEVETKRRTRKRKLPITKTKINTRQKKICLTVQRCHFLFDHYVKKFLNDLVSCINVLVGRQKTIEKTRIISFRRRQQ